MILHNPGAITLRFRVNRIAVFELELFRHVLMPSSEMAVEFLKSPFHRMVFFGRSEMPFPNYPGMITHLSQSIGDGRLAKRKPHVLIFRLILRVALETKALPITSRHESGPTGTTHRIGHITRGEFHPVFSDRINMRCRDVLAAIEAHIGIAHVIGHDDDQIRLSGGPGHQLAEE